MATHTIAHGNVAVHALALTAGTVETVEFSADYMRKVEIVSDGTAAVYFTVDGSAPTVAGANTYVLPAGTVSVDSRDLDKTSGAVVKLISDGTPTISVQSGD